jgi:hypothetical protein
MEIVNFIKWQWRRFEFWQKTFIFSAVLMIISLMSDNITLLIVGAWIPFIWMFKWWIWDVARENYQKFKDEKKNFFKDIKESSK